MYHKRPTMSLPRTDGSYQVFCREADRRVRPCNGRVAFSAEGVLTAGLALYFESSQPRYFCSYKCLAAHVRRVK